MDESMAWSLVIGHSFTLLVKAFSVLVPNMPPSPVPNLNPAYLIEKVASQEKKYILNSFSRDHLEIFWTGKMYVMYV